MDPTATMDPTIESARLRFRVPDERDAARVLQYFVDNRAHLEPWEPDRPEGFYTLPFWEDRLRSVAMEAKERLSLRIVLLQDDAVVGTVNFVNVVRGAFQSCNLGYSIGAPQQGRGLMREALLEAIPLAFDYLALHRIQAAYQPHNERSGRLLASLGFEKEGYAKDYLFLAGAWRDHVITALRVDLPFPPSEGA